MLRQPGDRGGLRLAFVRVYAFEVGKQYVAVERVPVLGSSLLDYGICYAPLSSPTKSRPKRGQVRSLAR